MSKRPRSGDAVTTVADAYRVVSMQEPTQGQLAAFPPNLTPLDKQVYQLRLQLPTSMILLVVCGYKVKFYGRDSRVASRRLGLVCVRATPFETSSFPVVRLAHYLVRLTEMGYVVAFANQVETAAIRATGAKSSTKVFERQITAVYSRATTSSATFEALHQQSSTASPAAAGVGEDDGEDDDDAAEGEVSSSTNTTESTAGHRRNQDSSLRFVLFLVHNDESKLNTLSDAWSLQVVSFLSLVASAPEVAFDDVGHRVQDILLKCDPCMVVTNSASLNMVEGLLERSGAQGDYHMGPSDTGLEDTASRSLIVGTALDARCTLKTLLGQFAHRFQLDGALPLLREMPMAELISGHSHKCLYLPPTACNALHLFGMQRSGGMGSLLQHLDRCWTKAGSRVLRSWLSAPLCDAASVRDRQCAIRTLAGDSTVRCAVEGIMAALKGYLSDPEATLSRMLTGHATVPEVVAMVRVVTRLHNAASSIPANQQVEGATDTHQQHPSLIVNLVRAVANVDAMEAVRALMGKMNLNARVASEVFEAVASLPQPIADVKAAMAAATAELQEELLSVRRVLGMPLLEFATIAGMEYLIDLPQAKLNNNKSLTIPSDWVVVSRTKSNVRFHTSAVLTASAHLFAARDKLHIACEKEWVALQQWFAREHTVGVAGIRCVLQSAGAADALYALHTVSQQPGYCEPTICEGAPGAPPPRVSILKGRHPMLDVAMGGTYVAADIIMQPNGVWLLTGPNMGGKSALMRTVGLFAIMAQLGCGVPALQCSMPLFDALYVRMGSEDAILDNRSTFLTEMVETQEILCSPHLPRSLVLMDELGQGTSSFDGLAVASATLEFLVHSGATVIFVTHHSTLCDKYKVHRDNKGAASAETAVGTVECKYMSFVYDESPDDNTAIASGAADGVPTAAAERNPRCIRFLHVPVDGVTPSSFGIQVAAMASLPLSVIETARKKSEDAESQQRRRVELHALSTFCHDAVQHNHNQKGTTRSSRSFATGTGCMAFSYYYAYIALSNLIVLVFTVDAFLTFGQFFPTVVFLTTSRVFNIMLGNLVAANIILFSSVFRKVFFGTLTPVERQRINEEFFAQVFESAIGLVYFQGILTTSLTVAFVLVGAFKMFHMLGVSRLESIERSVQRPTGAVRRLACFLVFAFVVDVYFMVSCASHIFEQGVNIYLMMLLSFSVMALNSLVTQVKLALYLLEDAGGANRGPARFYVDIVSSIIDSVLYVSFFAAMTRISMPLHLIRDLLRSLRNLLVTTRSFLKYRKLAANIDNAFPEATPEELEHDRRCAVCYDDMLDDTHCKRLNCGHCYHRECLRKWFETNSACPYCRKEVDAPAPVRQAQRGAAAAQAPPPPVVVRANANVDGPGRANGNVPLPTPPGSPGLDASTGAREEALGLDEASVRKAYETYLKHHQDLNGTGVAARDDTVATPLSSGGQRESELPDNIEALQAELQAYREYRRAIEAAALQLEFRIFAARTNTMRE